MKHKIKIGIIGGTGLDNSDIINDRKEVVVDTPFGSPSDSLVEGTVKGVPCVLLARHGRKHSVVASKVNYRANIWALKSVGCTHLIVHTACGSLKEELEPGDIVILDSFIDRTHKRQQTFFDGTCKEYSGICFLPMEPAFCSETRKLLISCAEELKFKFHRSGTCVTIEGPRFSSKAESRLFKSWGCDVINMTTVPEVVLAKEAGLLYASAALVTDYDAWRDVGESVSVDCVMRQLRENLSKALDLLILAVTKIAEKNWDEEIDALKAVVASSTLPAAHSEK